MARACGGTPTPEPEVDFGNALKSQSSYLELAQTFEDTGVSAYNGAGPELESKEALAAAGTIVQVEGRHAALIRMMRGEDPAPKAFDDALSIPQVRTRVEPLGELRGGGAVRRGRLARRGPAGARAVRVRRLECRGHRGVAQPGSAHRSGR